MNWGRVGLSAVADVFNGKTPSKSEQREDGFPVLKIKDVDENFRFRGKFQSFVDQDFYTKHEAKKIQLNDSLILNAAHNSSYVGSKQYCAEEYVVDSIATGEWLVCRANKKVLDPKYLNFWLRSAATRFEMSGLVKGIHLYPKDVARLEIPLPPLETQKQIAAILEKADQLRKDCQQMEQELNNLAQSVFMDMFGKHLESGQFVNLGEVADVVSGVTKGQKLEGKKTQMVPYMRVANVQAGYLDLSEIKDIEVKLSDVDKYRLECGDMLLTEGGDFDKLGRGALWEGKIENCIHQNHVFRVRLDRDKYLPEWFNGFLQTDFAKRYFLKCAKKTTNLASINITQLKGLPMPTVGVDLQNSFFDKIKIIKEKRELASKAFCEHDQTFNSLMQKAFNGELNIKTKAA